MTDISFRSCPGQIDREDEDYLVCSKGGGGMIGDIRFFFFFLSFLPSFLTSSFFFVLLSYGFMR